MIHLARDGANLGSFSEAEVQEGLKTGRFRPTDLAWKEGMAEWRPLTQVITETLSVEAAPGPSPAQPGMHAPAATPAGSTADTTPGSGLPWERRSELGFFKAFFDTVIMVLTQPATAFSVMKSEGDMASPMIFGLIGGSVGFIISILFSVAMHSIGIMSSQKNPFGMAFAGAFGLGYIIFAPLLVLLGLFIWTGIVHLSLTILGGAKKSFETTFRVVCYSAGSANLLSMVPLCGGMVAGIWNIVVQCIGLSRAHEIDTGKAVIAILLPVVVCCGGVFCLVMLGAFGAAMSQH